MISKPLIVAQPIVGAGPVFSMGDAELPTGNLQVSIVGTSASVSVYGRASPAMPWFDVADIATSGTTSIPLLAEMYAAVTAINAAVVAVAINYTTTT